MIDKDNIQHNLKTGADSDIIYIREVTDKKSADFGKLKTLDGIYKFPILSRSTGNSVSGTTETIESNELRKGRTKSAPRRGNSSAEGSHDLELSPTTFDDLLEAALRNEWKRWNSDEQSAINLDHMAFGTNCFMTRCTNPNEDEYNHDKNFGSRHLLSNFGGVTYDDALLNVPAGCVVHELTCGTKDIKYSLLKKFGGVDGEDLYQEFKHIAVNTLSLSVQIGAIVTGSFGLMGNNNPKLMEEDAARANFGGEDTDRFADHTTTGNVFIDNLPVKSTDTDQFTSREGDLWINGKNITFASNLTLELNNGLEKKYAIFVKDAISTTPLSLDITGDLTTYLVAGESDELYNSGIDDETNEIIFQFQDKEKDPEFIYLFQIFESKIGDQNISASGADTFDQSEPWNSFNERALRIFRIALPKVREIEFTPAATWTNPGVFKIRPNVPVVAADVNSIVLVDNIKKDDGTGGSQQTINSFTVDNDGYIYMTESAFSTTTDCTIREIEVTLSGETKKFSFAYKEDVAPAAPTDVAITVKSKSATITWTDSVATDLDHTIVDVQDAQGASVVTGSIAKGVQTYKATGLSTGITYTVDLIAVDVNGNKSTKVTETFTTSSVQLGHVTSLSVSATGQQIDAQWVKPTTDLDGVVVELYKGDTFVESITVAATATQEYSKASLDATTEYTVKVTPYKAMGIAAKLLGETESDSATTE